MEKLEEKYVDPLANQDPRVEPKEKPKPN